MHIIRKDVKNNRLYLTLYGVISFNEAKKVRNTVIKDIDDLKPGFSVINDISKLVSADEKAAPFLEEAIKYSLAKNVKRIVRIVGHSKAGLMLFAKYSPQTDSLEINYVPTLKEAEDLLEGDQKFEETKHE